MKAKLFLVWRDHPVPADSSLCSCEDWSEVEMSLLWKLGRTGKAGDTVGVLQWLVSNSLDRAHHLRSMLHKCCMGKGDQ